MAQDLNREVNFYLSIGYPTAEHNEIFTLDALNVHPDWTDEEVAEFLDTEQQEWANNYIDSGWGFENE